MADTGRFITFEGGEGVGKSTQIKIVSEHLKSAGVPHVVTREPGGSPGAEEIRSLLVTGEPGRWDVTSETLLLFAARQDLLQQVIRPALAAGKWVLCDRFVDSTYAYQGIARGMAPSQLDELTAMVVGDTQPDLTIVMDMDPAIALERIRQRRGNEDRFEKFPLEWHQRLAAAFRRICQKNPGRCFLADASQPEDVVSDLIWRRVSSQFLEN